MDDLAADGDWLIGDNAEEFAGKFEVVADESTVTLPRTALAALTGSDELLPDEQMFSRTLPVITGYLRGKAVVGGRAVSMFGCRLSSLGTNEIRVRSDVATIGYVAPITDAFTEVVLEFDWLRAWIRPPHVITSDWEPREEPATVDVRENVLCEAPVDGGSVALVVRNAYRTESYTFTASRHVYLRISLDQPCTWRQAINYWQRVFQDLLFVAIGKPVQLTGLHLRPELPEDHGRVELVARTSRRTADPKPNEARLMSFDSPVLLHGSDFKAHFPDTVERWMATAATYREAISRLTAPTNAQTIYLENRCAFVAQALEAYFDARFTKRERRDRPTSEHAERVARITEALDAASLTDPATATDIEWARRILLTRNVKSWSQMVNDVVGLAGELGHRISESLPSFSHAAEAMRHTVSHPPRVNRAKVAAMDSAEGQQADLMRFVGLHFTAEILIWVLRVVLLKACGHDVAQSAADNPQVSFAIARLTEAGIGVDL